jgi:hypothetical protein
MSTPRPPLTRSAVLGLAAGMVIGAVFLAVRAVTLGQADCEGLLEQDCALEREIAANLTRLHALFALGLTMVAGGLFLSLRKKP